MNTVSKTSFEKNCFSAWASTLNVSVERQGQKNEKGKKCSVGKHFFEIDDGFLKSEFYL